MAPGLKADSPGVELAWRDCVDGHVQYGCRVMEGLGYTATSLLVLRLWLRIQKHRP